MKSSGAGAGGGSSAGAGALPGSKTAAPKVIGQLSVMRDLAVVRKNEEFSITNEEFCIKNGEMSIKNGEMCIENDECFHE